VRWVSRLTTGAVIVIIAAGFALLVRSRVPTSKVEHASFKTYVKFRDGSRLAVGSPVVIAGVQVGLIRQLTIEGELARIDMNATTTLDAPVEQFTISLPNKGGDSCTLRLDWEKTRAEVDVKEKK